VKGAKKRLERLEKHAECMATQDRFPSEFYEQLARRFRSSESDGPSVDGKAEFVLPYRSNQQPSTSVVTSLPDWAVRFLERRKLSL